jgi:putative FmdB family regulatory protein
MYPEVIFHLGERELPLYPYRCTQCGHRFEKIQHFNAEPEKVCPKCGGALERLLTAPGLQFKGAGWYVNDYAPKTSSSSGDGSAAGEKADKSSETKSETKPESKGTTGNESNTAGSTAPTPPATSGSTAG